MGKLRKKPSKARKLGLTMVVIILCAGLATGAYAIFHTNKPTSVSLTYDRSNQPYPPALVQDNTDNNTRKNNPSSAAPTLDNGPTTDNSTGSTPADISVTVTRASVLDSNLQVGTLINGATSGTCTLYVSQSGEQTISDSNNVEQQNNAYVCPTFSIPTSEFPNLNDWNISVSVTSDGTTATGTYGDNPINLSGSS